MSDISINFDKGKEAAAKEEAEEMKKALEAAGAKVELK